MQELPLLGEEGAGGRYKIRMHPFLLELPSWIPLLGGKAIHTYGALVALGFLLGLFWIQHEAKRLGLDHNKVLDLFFYIVLSGLIGSRILYFIASVPRWWENPLSFFRFWEGGLVFYGGLIAATLVTIWYTRKHRMSFFTVADVFAPGLALGHAFGRLGCFAAGCCFGRPAPDGFPFGVTFPDGKFAIAPFGTPLYPTQLFEAAGDIAIFAFLFFFRKRKKFEGEVFLLYIILYPILRSIVEIYRGDKIRGFVIEGVLSTSQFLSLIWVIIAGEPKR